MNRRNKIAISAMLSLIIVFLCSCGRTPSRYMGKDHRQILNVPEMDKFISISFDKKGSSTVKDVTFLGKDGYIYTKEYKDISPLEGTIRWVPFGAGDSVIQSRTISRLMGGAVNLELPKDCAKVLGVDIGYASSTERVKNLAYLSTNGKILVKEYREGFIDRHFGGWVEIKK